MMTSSPRRAELDAPPPTAGMLSPARTIASAGAAAGWDGSSMLKSLSESSAANGRGRTREGETHLHWLGDGSLVFEILERLAIPRSMR